MFFSQVALQKRRFQMIMLRHAQGAVCGPALAQDACLKLCEEADDEEGKANAHEGDADGADAFEAAVCGPCFGDDPVPVLFAGEVCDVRGVRTSACFVELDALDDEGDGGEDVGEEGVHEEADGADFCEEGKRDDGEDHWQGEDGDVGGGGGVDGLVCVGFGNLDGDLQSRDVFDAHVQHGGEADLPAPLVVGRCKRLAGGCVRQRVLFADAGPRYE